MPTPHINAQKGDFAKTVLMPGDPLRAKFIAESFLDKPVQVNNVRGMLGYTGLYKGAPISVMGSGMGMPSIGIYSYELYTQYNVESIIRLGSAGSYSDNVKIFDVVLANASYSESSYAKTQNGYDGDTTYPSLYLNDKLKKSAQEQGIALVDATLHSSDVFYREGDELYWQRLRDKKKCMAVEMESFALFHNASTLGKNAACIVTISDSFVSHEATTANERERSFTDMMHIALGSILV